MFLLFGGETYYSCGGWNDYRGTFDTAEQAISEGISLMLSDNLYNDIQCHSDIQWFHVVNFETGTIIHREGHNYS